MSGMELNDEMRRLLAEPPSGALSALARACKVTSASVSAWRTGASAPSDEYLPMIEGYLQLPTGYLRDVAGGSRRRVEPTWPKVVRAKVVADLAVQDIGPTHPSWDILSRLADHEERLVEQRSQLRRLARSLRQFRDQDDELRELLDELAEQDDEAGRAGAQ